MVAHCRLMKPHSHHAFYPKGRCATTGRHEQTEAFLLSGRVFLDVTVAQQAAAIYRKRLAPSETKVERRRNRRSRVRIPPVTSKNILCRTPLDSRRVVVPARSRKAMRLTDRPAHVALESATTENGFQQYEAPDP